MYFLAMELYGTRFQGPFSAMLWALTAINLLWLGLLRSLPRIERSLAAVVAADVGIGAYLVVWALWKDWVQGSFAFLSVWHVYCVIGALGILLSAWVYSGNEGYELAFPVRGIWAKRMASGLALLMVQTVSATSAASVLFIRCVQVMWSPNGPIDLVWPAGICTATLPFYYLPLWKTLMAGRESPQASTNE